jgi:hypothetical protein
VRAGDAAMVEVTAHVVTIRNAAGADDAGIVNPLLHCFQDGSCGMHVFGLPAVKVCSYPDIIVSSMGHVGRMCLVCQLSVSVLLKALSVT